MSISAEDWKQVRPSRRKDLIGTVGKSADAAARYITDNLDQYQRRSDKGSARAAAYNRGETKNSTRPKLLINEQNKRCSICALTADPQ